VAWVTPKNSLFGFLGLLGLFGSEPNKQNKPNKPDKPDKPLRFFLYPPLHEVRRVFRIFLGPVDQLLLGGRLRLSE
jgi:hypothetical protein